MLSDDQGQLQPARFYTVELDVRDGRAEQRLDLLAQRRVRLGLAPGHVESPVEADHRQVLHQKEVCGNLRDAARGKTDRQEAAERRNAAQ